MIIDVCFYYLMLGIWVTSVHRIKTWDKVKNTIHDMLRTPELCTIQGGYRTALGVVVVALTFLIEIPTWPVTVVEYAKRKMKRTKK